MTSDHSRRSVVITGLVKQNYTETHLKRSREAKNKNWEDSYLYSCLDSKPMPKHGLGEPFGLQAGSKLNSLLGMLNNALNFLKFVPLGTREPQWKKKEKQIV